MQSITSLKQPIETPLGRIPFSCNLHCHHIPEKTINKLIKIENKEIYLSLVVFFYVEMGKFMIQICYMECSSR